VGIQRKTTKKVAGNKMKNIDVFKNITEIKDTQQEIES